MATSALIIQTLATDAGTPNWAEGSLRALYQLTDQTILLMDVSSHAGDTSKPAVNSRVSLMVNF